MKKTFNINLAGYPFVIDEDAYTLLKDYIDTIRYAFKTDVDTDEIAADIESRIAELLMEKYPEGTHIITIDDLSKVIARIGQPEEIIEIDETEERVKNRADGKEEIRKEERIAEENVTPPPVERPSRNPFARKRLFRDSQHGMIGGVCAGLAQYMGIDPTFVRIGTILLFFLSASTVTVAYIILWIVMPDARTPLQRMQMKGENPTMENIGRTVTENFREDETGGDLSRKNQRSGFSKFIYTCCSIFVKCLIIIGLIITAPILLALFIVLVACIIAAFAVGGALFGGNVFGDMIDTTTPGSGLLLFYLVLATIGGIITIGVPFYLFFSRRPKSRASLYAQNNRRSLVIIWLIGIALTAVFTVKTVKKAKQLNHEIFHIENVDEKGVAINKDGDNSIVINAEGIEITGKNGKKIVIDDYGVKYGKKDGSSETQETIVTDTVTTISEAQNDTIQ